MTSHSPIISIRNISSATFIRLHREYKDTLSCPCSTMSIPLKNFVSHTINYHPLCSSHFVSQQWIEALYLKDASTYGTGDFRSTASSQFQLLASLCSISQDTVSQKRMDLDNNEFVFSDLLLENQVKYKVNATIEFFKKNSSTGIISFLNYLRTNMQTNFLVSALNTNFLFIVDIKGGK
ncbi:hypothetical protein I4U23_005392 [Adineta vaga]|nr:hypothetical protein I4U23_005392 [Adineta vaga]